MAPVHLDYSSISPASSIPSPPGFTASSAVKQVKGSKSALEVLAMTEGLKSKKAWDVALAPGKALPMQAFMLYMSGSGIQVMSIGIVFMLLTSPIKGLFSIKSVFKPFQPAPGAPQQDPLGLLLPMAAFVACQAATFALGLWKCNQMGMLPTGAADFLAFETRGLAPEKAFFGL